MKRRIILALAAPAVVAAVLATGAFGVVSSTLVVRGNATAIDLHDKSQKLKLQAKEPVHVDIRHVTAAAGDVIGPSWHTHAGPSLVVVAGGSLTASQPAGQDCSVTTYGTGSTFVHSEEAHRFVAGSLGADIYIIYLLPEGAQPAAVAASAPEACLP